MKRTVRFLIVGLVLAALFLTGGCGKPAQTAPKKITFTVEAGNATKTTFYKMTKILQTKGYIVDIAFTGGGNEASQFILSGKADVAVNDTDELLLMVAQNADVKAFMSNAARVDYVLVGKPEYKTVADLKGKTIGMSGPAGFDAMMGRIAFQKAGLDPKSGNWVVIGGSPDRMKALEAGKIDAAVIFLSHYLQMVDKGSKNHKIADMAKVAPDVLKNVYYAKSDWLKKNPQIAKDIVAAQLEANKWFADNKASWVELALEWVKGGTRPAMEALYDALKAQDMFPADGAFTKKGGETMVSMMVDSGDLKSAISADKFMDFTAYDAVTKK